jgi:nucleotide-binding universal stress UspA family protein
MSVTTHRIVIGLDGSEYAPIVLEHAIAQAQLFPDPELHFVTVVERDREIEEAKRTLAALALPSLGDIAHEWHARLHVRVGHIEEELANLAAEIRAHLLVVGRFGTHHPHRKIGKTANGIVDLAPCPVLVVGLADQSPDRVAQCPDCVAVREATNGERLFCDAHANDHRIWSPVLDNTTPWSGGGLLW